jgi:PAS domain S-box-containing protein
MTLPHLESRGAASAHTYELLLKYSWDIVSILEADGVLRYNSPACERIHGYTPEELVGRNTADLIHPDDRAAVGTAMEFILTHPDKPTTVEYRYSCKDGRWVWMEAVGINCLGDPLVRGIVANSREISERKNAEALLSDIVHSQKLESLGALAGGLAHEMNNVLGAILGLASVHASRSQDARLKADLDTIVSASRRGGALVHRLLGLARQDLVHTSGVDINDLVREVVALLEQTTLQKIRFETELEEGALLIRGDASALNAMLMNLCVNAFDAMEARSTQGLLVLRTRRVEGGVEIAVQDNGEGMTKAVLARVLDPFFTTKPVGKGTGLGLPLVNSTVHAHSGRLTISSETGQGTTVTVFLPAGIPLTDQPPKPVTEAAPRANLELLVVDDDELVGPMLVQMTQALGHRATWLASGSEAHDRLSHGLNVDLLILDLNMPGWSGTETLTQVRRSWPELKILLTTGRVDQSAMDLVKQVPGVGLLPKPFSIEELDQYVQQAVRRGA